MASRQSSIGPSGRSSVGLERCVRYRFPVELHEPNTAGWKYCSPPKVGDPLDPRIGDVTSIVTVNGLTSGPFPVRRGVRQGCPLSPLLYVLFSETLCTSLDRCFGIRPFNVPGGARVKCVQCADDVTCIVSDLASFKPLSKVLTTFQEATGARLIKSKTKGLRLGGWRGQSLPFDATWSDVMIKVNGIWLGYGAPEAPTWAEKAEQVEARLDTFSHRWLSLTGKVTVVNRFIVPLLWVSWYGDRRTGSCLFLLGTGQCSPQVIFCPSGNRRPG
ncbi:pol-like protein [Apostichopus japonicus]|uniref:Pol-like protein n=1 Tax=Stichopus japonicus TaxID=307972 RepID=A0A2G8K1Y1_STIJA|nr:pol-like protein [Apostichopus japonicus]